jgi:hypothetical protein
MPVLYEAAGGIVEPEKMIQAHVLRAWYHGAHVKTGEAVRDVVFTAAGCCSGAVVSLL